MAHEEGIAEKEEASAVVARENDFPEGAEGGLEIGCDHLGFVAREDDVRCDANSRVSVEEVRFEIVTYIWALLSGEGCNGRNGGIVDVDFQQVFEPDLLLPFLGDALEGG